MYSRGMPAPAWIIKFRLRFWSYWGIVRILGIKTSPNTLGFCVQPLRLVFSHVVVVLGVLADLG